MSLVYVVQNQQQLNHVTGELESKFDLSAAEKWGQLVFLLNATAKPFTPDPVLRTLHRMLRNIRPEDHLLLLGSPILIGWAVAVAARYAQGKLSLLQWSGREREYAAVRCDLFTI